MTLEQRQVWFDRFDEGTIKFGVENWDSLMADIEGVRDSGFASPIEWFRKGFAARNPGVAEEILRRVKIMGKKIPDEG